jgi:hypothetical protein
MLKQERKKERDRTGENDPKRYIFILFNLGINKPLPYTHPTRDSSIRKEKRSFCGGDRSLDPPTHSLEIRGGI